MQFVIMISVTIIRARLWLKIAIRLGSRLMMSQTEEGLTSLGHFLTLCIVRAVVRTG